MIPDSSLILVQPTSYAFVHDSRKTSDSSEFDAMEWSTPDSRPPLKDGASAMALPRGSIFAVGHLLGLLVAVSLLACPLINVQRAAETASSSSEQPKVDRLWVTPPRQPQSSNWETAATVLETGLIKEFNANEVLLVDPQSLQPKRFPSVQVQGVEFAWQSQEGSDAHREFLARHYPVAITKAREAIAKASLPRWQQRMLGADITQSLIGQKQIASAGRVFHSLVKESSPEFLYAAAPINWLNDRPDQVLAAQAKEWLDGSNPPIVQLMGASWLLQQPGEESSAQEKIEQLAKGSASNVAQLARAQRWRMASPDQTRREFASWKTERNAMLPPLQLGPSMTIAYKLERSGLKEAALDEWLRVAISFGEYPPQAEYAGRAAVAILQESGKVEEAKRLTEQFALPP